MVVSSLSKHYVTDESHVHIQMEVCKLSQFTSIEFGICYRMAGLFLGAILGFFYVHYAWYQRGQDTQEPIKHIKIKGLGVFSIVTGVPACFGLHFQAIQPLTAYMLASGFLTVFLLILYIVISAYRGAFITSSVPADSRRLALKCATEAFFRGWPSAQLVLDNQMSHIHSVSKCNLIQIMKATYELLFNLSRNADNQVSFKSNFKAVLGIILYNFFQHHADAHPNFCVSYYQYSPKSRNEPLKFVVRLTGGSNYHAEGVTTLGPKSMAMECIKNGKIILFPDDKSSPKSSRLDPPLSNKKIKHFLLLPVPVGQDIPLNDRRGVLCIDTCLKDAWQLRDEFHLSLLKWCTSVVDRLHKYHLEGEPGNAHK